MAAGRDIGVGDGLESCTSDVRALRVRIPGMSQDVILVDTPGFDDTYKSDLEILRLISDWLKATGSRNIRLRGVLYLHRITDNRMAGTPLKNLELFERICGPKWFSRVVLVTTMWDDMGPENQSVGEKREEELLSSFWKGMIDRGSRTMRYCNNDDSAWEILKSLLNVPMASSSEARAAETKLKPQLQKETADKGRTLQKTEAGYELYRQIDEVERIRRGYMEKLDKQIARAGSNEEVRRIFQEQRDELKQQSEAAEVELGALRLAAPQRLFKAVKAVKARFF